MLPLESMVMPPGPLSFFSSLALRVPMALELHSLAAATSAFTAAGSAVVHVRLAPVDQVQIRHRIVVVGAIRHRLIQILQPFSRPEARSSP